MIRTYEHMVDDRRDVEHAVLAPKQFKFKNSPSCAQVNVASEVRIIGVRKLFPLLSIQNMCRYDCISA